MTGKKGLVPTHLAFISIASILIASSSIVLSLGTEIPPSPDDGMSTRYGTMDVSGFGAHICTWKDDRSAALSFTFDDGLVSQAKIAAPLLDHMGSNGTFFITLNNIGIP